MKKFLFGIFLGLIFILCFKLDSFASSNFFVDGYSQVGSGNEVHTNHYRIIFNTSNFPDNKFAVNGSQDGDEVRLLNVWTNSQVDVPFTFISTVWTKENDIWSSATTNVSSVANFRHVLQNGHHVYVFGLGSYSFNLDTSTNVPLYLSANSAAEYVTSLSSDTNTSDGDAINKDQLPFGSSSASNNIPTPVVNWALNSDGTLSRTLQFTNAQLPQNPNIRMGLQLIVHWASIDNITMSYSNQSASALGTGYAVFYDNALSQEGVPMGYPLPESLSQFKPCPSEIDFISNADSIALFNNFLVSHPVSDRTINYSPSGISSFADSFRTHLGDISFPYNVPYVSCRYYYKTSDNDLIYGGWANTYPKLPSQGAVLSLNKQNGEIFVPVNDGTFNQGTDIDGNPIFDNSITIDSPDLVNFDDLNNSVHNLFSYIGQFPSFLAYLFPFLPSWIPILLASIIGTLLVIGLVRIILK